MSSVGRAPAVELVRQLPAELTATIPPEFGDTNGHMNVVHFYGLHAQTTEAIYTRIGFPDPQRRVGIFTLETRVRHHAEILVGDTVTSHHRLLDFDGRRFHGVGFIVDATSDRVASSFEYLTAAVDLTTRRMTHLPEEFLPQVAVELDRGALAWDPPVFDRIAPLTNAAPRALR